MPKTLKLAKLRKEIIERDEPDPIERAYLVECIECDLKLILRA